jgi:RND family efflux transporter MFP subunit
VNVIEAVTTNVPEIARPNGTTRALQSVSLRARIRGYLREILFTEGQNVTKDQPLFVIDEDPYKAELASAQAKHSAAEAELAKAKESKAREIAAAQLALDEAVLALARIEEQRQRSLLARNAASLQDVDRAAAMREKNAAQVEADKANLAQAKADYDINILSAQAELDAAKAAVETARVNLAYCRINSPIDGRIGEAKVKVGNLVGSLVSSEGTELATIQQLDPMGIDVEVSDRYLERAAVLVPKGLSLELDRLGVDGEVRYPHKGTFFFLDNVVNSTTSTFLARARIPNPDETLLPGQYVKLDIVVGELADVITVPERAVIETQAGPVVYVVDAQNEVAIARVDAGTTYKGSRVIKSGLPPGSKVIVDGLQRVRPGMTVTPEPIGAALDDSARSPGLSTEPAKGVHEG